MKTKNHKKINRRKYYLLTGFSFLIILLLISSLHLLKKDNDFSNAEKRNLEKFPEVTWQSIHSGDFSKDIETYLTDQVPFRNQWVFLNTSWNRILGESFSNDVYNAKSGFLIQGFKEIDNSPNKLSKDLNDFLIKYPEVNTYVMLVPTASEIMSNKLPKNALVDSELNWYKKETVAFDKSIHLINLFDTFNNNKEKAQLFYKTDHHWTSEGAYLGFKEFASKTNIKTNHDAFTPSIVCDNFQGTLMAKSGFYSSTMDKITIYQSKASNLSTLVTYPESKKVVTSIFSEARLKSNNPYEVFLGGNYGKIQIRTNAGTGRKILLLKDSYANSFVQFLIPYFDSIDIIDSRYYADDIYQQMATGSYNDLLVLYNIETYANDNSLKGVLAEAPNE